MHEILLSPDHVERFHQKYTRSEGCWTWNAALDGRGYGTMIAFTKRLLAHRVAYALANNEQPGDKLVDHICHNSACVNPEHLRLVDHKQNGENRAGLQRNNSSGVQGVVWAPKTKNWHARVQHHGKRINIGYFKTISEAEAAVVATRKTIFTHNELDRAA